MGMANVLNTDKQIAVIGALAEGSSIRSIERITGIHRDTIMRLGVHVGKGCEMLWIPRCRTWACRYLQFDEVWGFIGKKERMSAWTMIRTSGMCGRIARLTPRQS